MKLNVQVSILRIYFVDIFFFNNKIKLQLKSDKGQKIFILKKMVKILPIYFILGSRNQMYIGNNVHTWCRVRTICLRSGYKMIGSVFTNN